MISYPIFYHLDPTQSYENHNTNLFINIIMFKYLNNLKSFGNKETQIINQLLNQVNKISFENPYYKDLLLDLINIQLNLYKDNISEILLMTFIENEIFPTIKDDLIKRFILTLVNSIYNNNVSEATIPKFYIDVDKIYYKFVSFYFIDDIVMDVSNDASSLMNNIFLSILDNIFNIKDLIELLSCFYIEDEPHKLFNTFSVFHLARIYEINHNLDTLYIDNILFLDVVKKKIPYLDKINDKYNEKYIYFYEFIMKYINNNLSVETINNNNMNSCLLNIFDDIPLISFEEDNTDDNNIDDDSTDNDIDDDSTDDNNIDDDSTDNDIDNSTKYKQYIKYKLKLVSDEEPLEDFLYKIALYKKIYNYVYSKNISTNIKKIEILKNWISKWIFLTSLSETITLIKQLKLKDF